MSDLINAKICTKCHIEKELSEFSKHKDGRFNVSSWCKICANLHYKQYCKENLKERLESGRKRNRKYRKANPQKMLESGRRWYKENLEKGCRASRNWQKANPEKVRANNQRYYIEKRKTDPKFMLNMSFSARMRLSLKGKKEGRKWSKLVGYTLNNLKKHLEKQFTEGMTWENYGRGGWEVDHKIPVTVFNYTKSEHEDFKRCWALSNLQPLWFEDNRKKGSKLTKHFQPALLL